MEQLLYALLYCFNTCGGFKTLNHHTTLISKEFGEIPLNVRLLLIVGILFLEHLVENASQFMTFVPPLESFLLRKILEKRIGIRTIYLNLLESGELSTIVDFTELMNRLISARSLLAKLITGEIKDFESLTIIFLLEFF